MTKSEANDAPSATFSQEMSSYTQKQESQKLHFDADTPNQSILIKSSDSAIRESEDLEKNIPKEIVVPKM